MRQAKATSAAVDARKYILVSPFIFLHEILPPFRIDVPLLFQTHPPLHHPRVRNPRQAAALRGARAFFRAPNFLPQAFQTLPAATTNPASAHLYHPVPQLASCYCQVGSRQFPTEGECSATLPIP